MGDAQSFSDGNDDTIEARQGFQRLRVPDDLGGMREDIISQEQDTGCQFRYKKG